MNSKTVKFTLTADVADDGTFTVSYPAGSDDGDFENAFGHYVVINGLRLEQPNQIGLSFGSAYVTVTNRTGAALLAGEGHMTFVYEGENTPLEATAVVDADLGTTRRVKFGARDANIVFIDLGSPVAASADGIATGLSATDSAQTHDSSAFAASFTGKLDVPRNLTLTGTAGSNHVVTCLGKDEYGQPMQEAITLSGATTVAGVKAFAEVTGFSVAAGAAGGTFTAGWGDVLGLPVRLEYDDILAVHENGVKYGVPGEYAYVPFEVDATKYNAGTSEFVVCPVSGYIDQVVTTVIAATTGAGSLGIELGGVAIPGLAVVIATGSAAGTIDYDEPTAPAAVSAGAPIEITGNGTPTAGAVRGHIRIRPAYAPRGSFTAAAGEDTEATATSADVRGTFDPDTACNGDVSFGLLALVKQPSIGGRQYYV